MRKSKRHEKNKKEFSKVLLVQESALIWIITIACLALSAYCIMNGYTGSLPWISVMITAAWAAYGVSQAFYYKKSIIENSKNGIKYETVMKELDAVQDKYTSILTNNSDFNEIIKDLVKNGNTFSSLPSATTETTIYTDTQDSSELDLDYGI